MVLHRPVELAALIRHLNLGEWTFRRKLSVELEFDDDVCPRAARDLLRQLDALLGALELYARI